MRIVALATAAVVACSETPARRVTLPAAGPAASSSPVAASAPRGAPADPLCHAFGGLVHGTSRCWTLFRASATIAPSERRPPPGARDTGSFACKRGRTSGELVVGATKLRVTCTYASATDVSVHATVVDDPRFPSLRGRTFALGSGGYTDFVNVIAAPRGEDVDLSVDFGVLD